MAPGGGEVGIAQVAEAIPAGDLKGLQRGDREDRCEVPPHLAGCAFEQEPAFAPHGEPGPETQLQPAPLIDGRDLMARGLMPGPVFKRVLDAVYDAQLEGSVRDKEAALMLAEAVAGTLKPSSERPSR